MAQAKRSKQEDRYVTKIRGALEAYREKHPRASVDAYRQNPASVRVRVIDPDFQGIDRVDRDSLIWTHLHTLPEDIQSEISMLVLLTPGETDSSLANLEFEHPIPSRI
jgi:stress-induced morphogen